MDKKSLFKLGTFIRTLITTNRNFSYISKDLNVDNYTDPMYVLDCVKQELAPSELEKIVEIVNKSPVKDFVEALTQHESNSFD